MTTKFLIIPICFVLVALSSCNGSSDHMKNKDSDEVTDSTSMVATDSLSSNNEDSEVSYSLPSALQIAYVFKKSGSKFMESLPNNKSSYTKYNTSNYKRATNFGVYSSDLAYCLFNKRYDESKDYLKACKEMGSYLGLNQAFESDNLSKRFDKNISNEDSLVKIVSTIQLKTDIMFEQNKQKHITSIAFVGAWTESVYIAFEVYKKEKNQKVLASLLEQLLLSETIVKALKNYKSAEPEMEQLIATIEKINMEYNAIGAVKAAIEKDEEFDFSTMKATDKELEPLQNSINTLRKNIID